MDEPKIMQEQLDSFRDYAHKLVGTHGLTIDRCLYDWLRADGGHSGRENLRDRLIASGVLGCGSSEHPTDLSTNPEHMNGFGEAGTGETES